MLQIKKGVFFFFNPIAILRRKVVEPPRPRHPVTKAGRNFSFLKTLIKVEAYTLAFHAHLRQRASALVW
jgi:hypothetical protein